MATKQTVVETNVKTPVAAVSATAEAKAVARQLAAVKRQLTELGTQEKELNRKLALLKIQAIQEAYQDKTHPFSVTIAYAADSLVPALVDKVVVKNLATAEEAQAVAKKILALKLGSMTTTGTVILNGRKKAMVFATATFKGCFPAFKRDGWYWISEAVSQGK